MAIIGSLVVDFLADIAGFSKDTKKAGRDVSRFSKNAERSMSTVKKAVLGAVGAFTFGAAINSLRRTAEEMDAIGKTSRRLGIATEALVGLRHGAEQSGIGAQQLEMSMQRATRRIADASIGVGEAVKALQELNLSASNLAKMSPDKQLELIADAFGQVEDQAHKVRLAFKLFDSEGVKMLNLLEGGAAGLRKFKQEAKDLGLTFSGEQAKQIEEFNDQMDRLAKSFGGLKRDLIIDIAPAAISAIETLRGMMDTSRTPSTVGGRMAKAAQEGVGDFIGGFFTSNPNLRKASRPDAVTQERLDKIFKDMHSTTEADIKAQEEARRKRIFGEGNRIRQEAKQRKTAERFAKALHEDLMIRPKQEAEAREKFKMAAQQAGKFLVQSPASGFLRHEVFGPGGGVIGQLATALTKGISDPKSIAPGGPSLVHADTREGFMALRRNMNVGETEQKKATRELEKQTPLLEQIKDSLEFEMVALR